MLNFLRHHLDNDGEFLRVRSRHGYAGSCFGFGSNVDHRSGQHVDEDYRAGEPNKYLYNLMGQKNVEIVDLAKKLVLRIRKKFVAKYGPAPILF